MRLPAAVTLRQRPGPAASRSRTQPLCPHPCFTHARPAGTVKEILGTSYSVGCTVDGKHPKDIIAAIDDGEIDLPDA